MTEQQKVAIQEAAESHIFKHHGNSKSRPAEWCHDDFVSGAEEVITNPGKYGLVTKDELNSEGSRWAKDVIEREHKHEDAMMEACGQIVDLQAENQRYKEALEGLMPLAEDGYKLHKSNGCHQDFLEDDREALKVAQQALKGGQDD